MPNISLPTLPKSLKVSKRLLLVIGGSLAVILVLLVSLAVYQRHNDRVAQEDTRKAVQAAQANKAVTDRIATLEAQNKALVASNTAACSYLKALATQKATRGLVIVPTAVNCPN